MIQWQRRLRLHPEWQQAENGDISVHELAATVATRLGALAPFGRVDINTGREDLVSEFEALAKDADSDVDDFDAVMDRLYDWADTQIGGSFSDAKKVCWIDRWGP